VDNGSTDGTRDYLKDLARDRPNVRLVFNQSNTGFAGGCNQGMGLARGEYILLLNNDVVLTDGWLSRLIAPLERDPVIGIVGPRSNRVVGEQLIEAVPYDETLAGLPEFARQQARQHEGQGKFVPIVIGFALLMRREVAATIGGLDTRFGLGNFEDVDYCLRAQLAGWTIWRADDAFVHHFGSRTFVGEKIAYEDQAKQNHAIFLQKWGLTRSPQSWPAVHEMVEEVRAKFAAEREALYLPLPDPVTLPRPPQRILMVMYGWADSGGGTILPRSIAKELVRRGNEVLVFYAGVASMPGKPPYHLHRHEEDGVQLRGVFNRPHVFTDVANPTREIEDPPITEAFRLVLDEFAPDVVHIHNLHNHGAALAAEIGRRGLRGFFTPHNYWLVCPRLYLFDDGLNLCAGPGDGSRCAPCLNYPENAEAYVTRRSQIRAAFIDSGLTCLSVSSAVRDVLVGNGYPADRTLVLYQGHQPADRLWREVGAERAPAVPSGPVVFSFIGSALPHKGVGVLINAAQRLTGSFEVRIYGDCAPQLAKAYQQLDKAGAVRFMGPYSYDEMPAILRQTHVAVIPSAWYDNAPLAVNECLAARVPVLGANIGGIPEFLEPGKTGDVFAPRDPDSLAARMQALIDAPETIA
ncbi:MAG: glycosyltransferase, partial [Cyanobacteria bacterium REEB65]|nr:glycosyltransferase [Cyanobacteria bacterium REEB65]